MFKQQYEKYQIAVENFLAELPWEENLISQAMKYSLLGGGKRIRPVLALASAELVGGNHQDLVREACAIELIHTYSLIHDDLPAMDNDDFRRGKPSNHKQFGEAAAILAGDALLTYAFELLTHSGHISAVRRLRVIKETAQAAGWQGMVGGQVMDTLDNGQEITLAGIEDIHRKKTGSLLRASARLGAILGGGNEKEIETISDYASHLGLAFQIQDDILDIVGESNILGKQAGSDQKLAKPTYPTLLGLEGARTYLAECTSKAKESVGIFGDKAEFLVSLADYVAGRNH